MSRPRRGSVHEAAGSVIIRWASSGSAGQRPRAATTSGPNVMLGTKWPSMTSRWIRSTPAARACGDRGRGCRSRRQDARRDARADRSPRPALARAPASAPGVGSARHAARPRSRTRAARGAAPRPGRRLARALGRELAAGGADLLTPVAPDVSCDAGRAQRRRERLDALGIGLGRQGVWATGFIGMRLTCARSAAQQVGAAASASTGVSLMPSIITYSYVTRRPVVRGVARRRVHDLRRPGSAG